MQTISERALTAGQEMGMKKAVKTDPGGMTFFFKGTQPQKGSESDLTAFICLEFHFLATWFKLYQHVSRHVNTYQHGWRLVASISRLVLRPDTNPHAC
jgi:hypothetical protein